ncbi:MAG: hypothetical protein NTY94_19460 [Alphaproteobacteria bacterium]|nr:hypothetical protein [Alphaproteobacteria bacterium]
MHDRVLIVAHPGHELRLFGWMRQNKPLFCILTDGSGGGKQARLEYSAALASACGVARGPVFGQRSDRDWYADILAGNPVPFLDAADRIARAAPAGAVVVADPVEGYNPMHDLTAALADRVAAQIGGRRETFALTRPLPGAPTALDEATVDAKRAALAAYAPLADEAAALLSSHPQALHDERLVPAWYDWPAVPTVAPAYERFGKDRIAAGHYRTIIRYVDHVRPIALALRRTAALVPVGL